MDNYFSDVKVDTGVMDTKGTVHCTVTVRLLKKRGNLYSV